MRVYTSILTKLERDAVLGIKTIKDKFLYNVSENEDEGMAIDKSPFDINMEFDKILFEIDDDDLLF